MFLEKKKGKSAFSFGTKTQEKGPECPLCRKEVDSVSPHAEKAGWVERCLQWEPERARDPGILRELDEANMFKRDVYSFKEESKVDGP